MSRLRSAFETTTLTNFRCHGNETDIRMCEYVNGTACTQKEYVSVACSNLTDNATQGRTLRLVSHISMIRIRTYFKLFFSHQN